MTNSNQEMEAEYRRLAQEEPAGLLVQYQSAEEGLAEDKAAEILEQHGRNQLNIDKPKSWLHFFLLSFKDEFILVLIALGFISLLLDDTLGGIIIFILAFISAMMRFVQDYSAYRSSEKLKTMVHTMADVRRGGRLVKINVEDIVPGDVVELGSGSVIPADLCLLESRDLFIAQSMFTGESVPVEKKAGACTEAKNSTDLSNICLMGANVVSGSGVGLVIKTGHDTYLGHISVTVEQDNVQTNFDNGLKKITRTLMTYMSVVVICVLLINGFLRNNWLQAFMFSISVAVGITPSMLPMIVNSTLAKGAQFLAKKKTIVKNMAAIQNLGAMDVLCTDKTGTLTIDDIVLQRYLDVNGNDSKPVLNYAYLNSYYSTGIKNLIDHAILEYGDQHNISKELKSYKKIDEIPFDYDRRRVSVIVEGTKGDTLVTKGALEEIIKICDQVLIDGRHKKIDEVNMNAIKERADALNQDGMHVIAVAAKKEKFNPQTFSSKDETGLTFLGYIAFLDPPKPDVKEAIANLYHAGVDVKVISGDAPLVVKHVCDEVGLRSESIIDGTAIEQMSDAQLSEAVESINVFGRLAPMQKQRVVEALKKNGHVVGYMGDGVNDAPSLRAADVGISVDTASDIAKSSSDIILLEKSLGVILDGVYEGRRIYGNIIKYMKMALSSNFGNVFSVLVASIVLPFLPMIPIQILIQNLIYDFTQIAIPWDNVDPEFLEMPHQWDTRSLSTFMNYMGIVSSVFDMLTFWVLWNVLGYNSVAREFYFQTGWFVEGLISQILIVHFIRTEKIPFLQSHADYRLTTASAFGIIAALWVPNLFRGISGFNFVVLPSSYYIYLVLILLLYAVAIQIVKKFYIRKYKIWL